MSTAAEPTPENLAVRLAANSLVQAGGSALASLIAFFTFVAATRALGPEAFGHLTAATAFLFIPTVLAEAGLSAAILREISAAPERTEPAIRASIPPRTAINVAAIVLALAVGLVMPFPYLTKVAIAISSVGALFTLFTSTLVPVLQAQLKMHWAVAATLAGRLATLGLTLGFVAVGFGFEMIVAAQVAGLGITFALHALVIRRLVSLRPTVDLAYWRTLVAGSLILGLAIALSLAYFRVDALLLALIRSAHEVGLYGAAYKFIELSALVLVALQTSVVPPLTRFVATGDPRATGLTQKAFDVHVATATPLAVGMVVFATPIVIVSAGPEFREAADALRLLGPFVLFTFINGLFFNVLVAARRDRILLATSAGVLVLNVVLNLIFLPVYGFRAAAVLSVVSEALLLAALLVAVRRHGLVPRVGYGFVVAAAAAAMVVVGLVVPGPSGLAAAVAVAAYAAVLLVLPGTARDVFFGNLLPATKRYLARGGA